MTTQKPGSSSHTACHKACEEPLRLALEAADLAVWDFDPVAGTLDGSSRFKTLWGLKAQESLAYAGWLERLHPEGRQPAGDAMQRSLDPAGTGQLDIRYRIVQPDGSVRWLSMKGRTHFEEVEGQRRGVRVVGILLDITEQKQAEVDDRRNEARLESLLRISQYRTQSSQELLDFALAEAIALTGSQIGYIYRYDEAKKELTLNSWSKEVMKQCTVAERQTVFQLEKTGLWGEAVRQARPIIINDFQAAHPQKKGYPEGHAPLHKYMTLPVLVDGHIVGVVGVANKETDYDCSDVRQLTLLMDSVWKITDRKRAKEGLREANQRAEESLARLQAVVESMTDALVIADPAGNLAYHNSASMALHGYRSREEACRPADKLACLWEIRDLNGRLLPAKEWPIARSLRGERYTDVELLVRRPDTGTEFIGSYNGTPVYDRSGQMILAIVTIRDVTEIKRAERRLKELNQTLEQRVVERTAVAEDRAAQLRILASQLTQAEQRERQRVAQILHEHFQQLLVGATFDVSLLKSQLCGRQDCKGPPILERINQVLSQSIADSRSLSIELSPPILNAASLAEALRWLGRWMHDKYDLAVDVHAEETAEPQAENIRILLFHAVRELLFNVIKHAHTSQASVGMKVCQGFIRIVVADNGTGLAQDELRVKADSSSGFGLFGLRERLEVLGGQLQVDSRPGQGTRITLKVPASAPKAAGELAPAATMSAVMHGEAAAPGRPLPDAGPGKIRILLADDHIVVRNGLASLLQVEPDIEVVGQAADGHEAVQMALQLQPDVILMDVTMPRLGGVEATRQIVSQLPKVRVIGLSMHKDEAVAAAMKEAGAVSYVNKTAPPESLVAAIRTARNACV